jgi:predicted dehydrogenase
MKKKINISIVGTGLMGLQHIKAISKSKKAKLHSIVDISKNAPTYLKNLKFLFTLMLKKF